MQSALELENIMIVKNIKQSVVAEVAMISQQAISEYIKGVTELSFESAYALYKSPLIFNGDSKHLLSCFDTYKLPKNIKTSLEYLSTFRHLDMLKDKLNDSKLARYADWVNTYALVYDYQTRSRDDEHILSDVRQISSKVKDSGMKALLTILEANLLFALGDRYSIITLCSKAQDLLDTMKTCYVKDSLQVRVYELLSQYYIYKECDLQRGRYYAEKIICSDIGTIFKAEGYYTLGISFAFSDRTKALELLKRSHSLYASIGRIEKAESILANEIAFVNNIWDKPHKDVSTLCCSEKAFYYAKKGDVQAATYINQMKNTPFKTLFEGILNNDCSVIFKALSEFVSKGDILYAQLPVKYLKGTAFEDPANILYKTVRGERD